MKFSFTHDDHGVLISKSAEMILSWRNTEGAFRSGGVSTRSCVCFTIQLQLSSKSVKVKNIIRSFQTHAKGRVLSRWCDEPTHLSGSRVPSSRSTFLRSCHRRLWGHRGANSVLKSCYYRNNGFSARPSAFAGLSFHALSCRVRSLRTNIVFNLPLVNSYCLIKI